MEFSGSYNKEYIKNILISNGYPVREGSGYISTAALWRGGSDPSSCVVYYNDNFAADYVDGKSYKIKDFISLVCNIKDQASLDKLLKESNFQIKSTPEYEKIKVPKFFDKGIINNIIPKYDYFLKRGISENTLSEFKSGLYSGDIKYFNNRYVFPCFNSKGDILMVAGRDVTEKNKIYWLLKGQKKDAVYPAFINSDIIKDKKSVFLVEGIGDALTLWECGIKNVLVLFGVDVSLSIINFLLKVNVKNIYISTNNDSLRGDKESNVGNLAAKKIKTKLSRYFDDRFIKIVLPSKKKDWNETLINFGKDDIIKELNKYE